MGFFLVITKLHASLNFKNIMNGIRNRQITDVDITFCIANAINMKGQCCVNQLATVLRIY